MTGKDIQTQAASPLGTGKGISVLDIEKIVKEVEVLNAHRINLQKL